MSTYDLWISMICMSRWGEWVSKPVCKRSGMMWNANIWRQCRDLEKQQQRPRTFWNMTIILLSPGVFKCVQYSTHKIHVWLFTLPPVCLVHCSLHEPTWVITCRPKDRSEASLTEETLANRSHVGAKNGCKFEMVWVRLSQRQRPFELSTSVQHVCACVAEESRVYQGSNLSALCNLPWLSQHHSDNVCTLT